MNSLQELKNVKVDPSPETWNKIEKTLHRRILLRRSAIVVAAVAIVLPITLWIAKPSPSTDVDSAVEMQPALASAPSMEVVEDNDAVALESVSVLQDEAMSLAKASVPEDSRVSVPGVENVTPVAPVVSPAAAAPSPQVAKESAIPLPTKPAQTVEKVEEELLVAAPEPVSSQEEKTSKTVAPKSPTLPTESNLTIPNVVLPNADDAENRTFVVHSDSPLTAYRLFIYNRGGRLVYQTTDINASWDCTHDGTPVPQGTYVYIIHYSDCNGKPFHKKGTVTVIR